MGPGDIIGRSVVTGPGVARPLTLIEVGASAGLCPYPDRYHGRPLFGPADSPAVSKCTVGPVPLPTRLPKVVHQAGVDPNPLDVADP